MATRFVVQSLQCQKSLDGLSDVVISVDWSIEARNGEEVARVAANTKLPNPEPGSFVDFSDLTPKIVENWIKTDDNTHYSEVKARAESELAAKLAVPVVNPSLPWDKPPAIKVPSNG